MKILSIKTMKYSIIEYQRNIYNPNLKCFINYILQNKIAIKLKFNECLTYKY